MPTDELDLDTMWTRAAQMLDGDPEISNQLKGFIGLTRPLGILEDTVLIGAPNEFARQVFEDRLRDPLMATLSRVLGRQVGVAVTVQQRPPVIDTPRRAVREDRESDFPTGSSSDGTGRQGSPSRTAPESSALNPKYTLESFVIGTSNRFAHAAAVAVAEAPAKAYNPLFIYGDSGLGKTHLLHAIGHYAMKLYPGTKVRYVSTEEFTNDFINAIRDDRNAQFHRRYRENDILLVDDIQFLENKERTQEEFFHTFNTLHNANKQLVITSDRSPQDLSTLEDRLRSRFQWGLITDVQPPDVETRIAILRKKAASEQIDLPDEVLAYIASQISTNIRQIEGALLRITAFASLNRQPLDLATTEIVLKDMAAEANGPEINYGTIMAITADYYGLTLEELCGPSRSRPLVQARQVAMYLCREKTDMSLPAIGNVFGDRDHTTVLHACRRIQKLMHEKLPLYTQINEISTRIQQRTRIQS